MQKIKWLFVPVMMGLVFLFTPFSAFAASPKAQMPTAKVSNVQASKGVKLLPGQQVDLPQKDGTTRHVKLSQPTGVTANTVTPNASGCSWFSESEWATNIFGSTLWKYSITQYACYSGSAITYLPASSFATQTCCTWSLSSQNHYNGWVSNPWQAYAHGDFSFGGAFGNSANGWVEVYVQGDGSYWGYSG